MDSAKCIPNLVHIKIDIIRMVIEPSLQFDSMISVSTLSVHFEQYCFNAKSFQKSKTMDSLKCIPNCYDKNGFIKILPLFSSMDYGLKYDPRGRSVYN